MSLYKGLCVVYFVTFHISGGDPAGDSFLLISYLLKDMQQHFFTDNVVIIYEESIENAFSKKIQSMLKIISRNNCPVLAVPTSFKAIATMFDETKSVAAFIGSPKINNDVKNVLYKVLLPYVVWILFLESGNVDAFFKGIHIPFDSEFIVAQREGHVIHLTEVYRVHEDSALVQQYYGNWSISGGPDWPGLEMYNRRNDLLGLQLTAAAIHRRGNAEIATMGNQTVLTGGYLYWVWKMFENTLNFRTAIVMPADNDRTWGNYVNGSWTGLVGMVTRGEADVGLSLFSVSSERARVVDFASSLSYSRYGVHIKKPNKLEFKWTTFVDPFSFDIWLAILLAIFIASSVLFVICHYGKSQCSDESHQESLTFQDSLFHTFGIFCLQGWVVVPSRVSSRMVFIFAFLTSTVLLSSYSAFVVSSITFKKFKLPFTNYQEMLDQGQYRLAFLDGSVFNHMFSTSPNEVYEKVYKKHTTPIKNSLPVDSIDGLMNVCNEPNYAFLVQDSFVRNYQPNLPCQVIMLPEMSFTSAISIIMSKNSPYRGIINFLILKLLNGGILRKMEYRDYKLINTRSTFTPVSLEDIVPLMIIVVCGSIFAIIVLVLEKYVSSLSEENTHLGEIAIKQVTGFPKVDNKQSLA